MTLLSELPERILALETKQTDCTEPVWPTQVLRTLPVAASHSIREQSVLPVAIMFPLSLQAMLVTMEEWTWGHVESQSEGEKGGLNYGGNITRSHCLVKGALHPYALTHSPVRKVAECTPGFH